MNSCVTIIHPLQNGLIVEVSLDLFGNVRGQEDEAFDYLTIWCGHKVTDLVGERHVLRVCDVIVELDIL